MRRDPLRVRLSGRGGQGVILVGTLLAEAAMFDGLHVVQTQSYGPEARLGAAKSEVVLSEGEIAFPEVMTPDILLCLSREAYQKFGGKIAPDGLMIIEEGVVQEVGATGGLPLALRGTARAIGLEMATNVVGLGALCALTGAVSEESLRRTVRERVKAEFLDLNLQALEAGLELGRQQAASH